MTSMQDPNLDPNRRQPYAPPARRGGTWGWIVGVVIVLIIIGFAWGWGGHWGQGTNHVANTGMAPANTGTSPAPSSASRPAPTTTGQGSH